MWNTYSLNTFSILREGELAAIVEDWILYRGFHFRQERVGLYCVLLDYYSLNSWYQLCHIDFCFPNFKMGGLMIFENYNAKSFIVFENNSIRWMRGFFKYIISCLFKTVFSELILIHPQINRLQWFKSIKNSGGI